jgi:hypothetical protein
MNITLQLSSVLDLDTTAHSAAFSDFMGTFLASPDVRVGLRSLTNSSLVAVVDMALGEGITISAPMPSVSTTVPGMDSLGSVTFESFELTGTISTPGIGTGAGLGIAVTVNIQNPSPANVPLGGNVTMAVLGPDPITGRLEQLGTVVGVSLQLKSGPNSLAMHGVLNSPVTPQQKRALEAMTSAYLTGHATPVSCSGVGVTMLNGDAAPMWLQAAVQKLHLSTYLPPAAIPELLTNFDLSSLSLNFTGGNGGAPITQGDMFAQVHLPFRDIPVSFDTANVVFDIMLSPAGVVMAQLFLKNVGTLYSPYAAPKSDGSTGKMTVQIPPTAIQVRDEALMAEFVKRSFLNDSLALYGRLRANQSVTLPLGQLQLTGVNVPVVIPL